MSLTKRTLRLVIALALGVSASGCQAVLGGREPKDSGFLDRYDDLRPGKRFRKVAIDPDTSLKGATKVWVKPFEVTRAVTASWLREPDRLETHFVRAVAEAYRAFTEELTRGFIVLQDASFADEGALVIETKITRLAPINVPGRSTSVWRRLFPPQAAAGVEIVVLRLPTKQVAVRIKDWRAGRQAAGRPVAPGGGGYADMLTVFHFWGRRVRGLLAELTRPGD